MDPIQLLATSIDRKQILVKTAKGLDEVQTRAHDLSGRLRRLLIMVDGRITVGDLAKRLASLDDNVEGGIMALLADGFLAPRSIPTTSQPVDEAPEFNLEKAKGFARFVVLGAIGPAGARRIARIDAAKSTGELRMELDDLRDLLPTILPKRQAKHVWDQLEPLMTSLGSLTPSTD